MFTAIGRVTSPKGEGRVKVEYKVIPSDSVVTLAVRGGPRGEGFDVIMGGEAALKLSRALCLRPERGASYSAVRLAAPPDWTSEGANAWVRDGEEGSDGLELGFRRLLDGGRFSLEVRRDDLGKLARALLDGAKALEERGLTLR